MGVTATVSLGPADGTVSLFFGLVVVGVFAVVVASGARVVGAPVGAFVGAAVMLRKGAAGGAVGLAVITAGSAVGRGSWTEAPMARPSSRSRGHTPILP